MTAVGHPRRQEHGCGEGTRIPGRADRAEGSECADGDVRMRRIPPIAALNLGLKFLHEVGALAALACGGMSTGPSGTRPALAIAAPLIAATLWSVWAAPQSNRRLSRAPRTAVELSVFTAATGALVVAGAALIAAAFAAMVLINVAVGMRWQ